jgi:MFS family permease
MSETTETHYCHYHPNTPTSLRCNKCGKYICIKDARRTPVGYRCKECVREQQDTFFTATPVDYVITGVIALPLAFIAAQIVPRLGFITIFAGPIVGIIISEIVHRATGKRRGRYTWLVALACLIFATVLPLLPEIGFVLSGALAEVPQASGGVLLNLGFVVIYLVLAGGTLASRLRFG